MNIVDEIKQSFKKGSVMTKIIYVNLGVFILINLIDLFFILFKLPNAQLISWLAVPADINFLLHRPWTIITYMFLHKDILHILFNLLWFYWFAKIFLDYLDAKKLLGTYIIGGIAGAILYIAAYNIFPIFRAMIAHDLASGNPSHIPMIGASASVLAVVTAISFYVPNLTMNLIFIGPVKLKYIALGSILLSLVSISKENPGGNIAHLGGALWGYIFVMQYKKGTDLNKWFSIFSDWLFNFFKRKPKLKVTYKKPVDDRDYNYLKTKEQERINIILDKISKSGYSSLTKEEKDLLFKASNK